MSILTGYRFIRAQGFRRELQRLRSSTLGQSDRRVPSAQPGRLSIGNHVKKYIFLITSCKFNLVGMQHDWRLYLEQTVSEFEDNFLDDLTHILDMLFKHSFPSYLEKDFHMTRIKRLFGFPYSPLPCGGIPSKFKNTF